MHTRLCEPFAYFQSRLIIHGAWYPLNPKVLVKVLFKLKGGQKWPNNRAQKRLQLFVIHTDINAK